MIDPRPLHERFDLTYVHRRQWPNRWTTPVSVALVLIVGGVLAWWTWRDDRDVYSSGPLTSVHATFGHNCAQCHEPDPTRNRYWLPVTDAACLKCHADATAHHPGLPDAPANAAMAVFDRFAPHAMATNCTSCHSEHQGPDFDLTRVADNTCTECHGQLHGESAEQSPYHAIHDFVEEHPDWRVLAEKQIDPTPLRMGHELHMNPKTPKMQETLREWKAAMTERGQSERDMPIQRVEGELLSLTCTACHQTDDAGRYMLPIEFEQHCVQCHALGSVRFNSSERKAIPHGSAAPPFIALTAREKAADTSKPAAPASSGGPRRGPKRAPAAAPAPAPDENAPPAFTFATQDELLEHVAKSVDAERTKLLAFITPLCGKCHGAGVEPSTIKPPNIPDRWLEASEYSHEAHRFVSCAECHPGALLDLKGETDSPPDLRWTGRTKDVMLPDIASCRACHTPTLAGGGVGARSDCVMCHLYHDPPLNNVEGGAFRPGTNVLPLSIGDFTNEQRH